MKKTLFSLLIILICFFALTACEETPAESEHQHSWGDWVVEKEADCKSEGELVRRCFECNEEECASISKLQHNQIIVLGKAPTCTERGCTDAVCCSKCDEVITPSIEIQKIPHEPTTVSGKPSTCTEVGYSESVSCSACGEIITPPEELEKEPHTPSDWIIVSKASCSKEGLKRKECTTCKIPIEEESTEKEAHTESGWRFEAVATCTKSGLKYKVCTVCSEKIKSEIDPMLEHSFKETVPYEAPTYQESGKKAHLKCTRCTAISLDGINECTANDVYLPKLDYINKGEKCPGIGAEHTMTNAPVAFVKTAEPDCDSWGYDVYECITCKAPVLTNWSESAHQYDLTVPIGKRDPGCETYGFWFYGCSVCGEPIDTDEGNLPIPNDAPEGSEWVSGGVLRLPKLGHAWDETKTNVTTPPTCTSTGLAVCFCVNCKDYYAVTLESLGHAWSDWDVVTTPTETSEGEKMRSCTRSICAITETKKIPPLDTVRFSCSVTGESGNSETYFTNGEKLILTIYHNAYNVDLCSIAIRLNYDSQTLSFVSGGILCDCTDSAGDLLFQPENCAIGGKNAGFVIVKAQTYGFGEAPYNKTLNGHGVFVTIVFEVKESAANGSSINISPALSGEVASGVHVMNGTEVDEVDIEFEELPVLWVPSGEWTPID